MTRKTLDPSYFMRAAIDIAETARLRAAPNPWVGCVIVRDEVIVAQGATQTPGCAHAERVALYEAGEAAQGATAYVTLEPCAHYGRTPPCTKALVEAGIKKVIYSLGDPDPQVSGRGAEALRASGIEVESGLLVEEASAQLAPYLHHRQNGSAYCIVKAALSLDGRVAAKDGSSQWITGPLAREDAHALRAKSQAILIGTATAIEDRPRLTVRHPDLHPVSPPLRVILDAEGRIPCIGPLFDTTEAPSLILTSALSSTEKRREWDAAGVDWLELPLREGHLDLELALHALGQRGILQVLVEGGGLVHGALLAQGLCQEIITYIGPKILGPEGRPAFGGLQIESLEKAIEMELVATTRLGSDVRLDYRCHPRNRNI